MDVKLSPCDRPSCSLPCCAKHKLRSGCCIGLVLALPLVMWMAVAPTIFGSSLGYETALYVQSCEACVCRIESSLVQRTYLYGVASPDCPDTERFRAVFVVAKVHDARETPLGPQRAALAAFDGANCGWVDSYAEAEATITSMLTFTGTSDRVCVCCDAQPEANETLGGIPPSGCPVGSLYYMLVWESGRAAANAVFAAEQFRFFLKALSCLAIAVAGSTLGVVAAAALTTRRNRATNGNLNAPRR